MIRRAAGALVLSLAIVAACTPIEAVPLTSAPTNSCPCEGFTAGAKVAPRCRNGRCEIPTPANRPDYPFFIVVDVPTSSLYAPGATFTFFADVNGDPAFRQGATALQPGVINRCLRPSCLSLGEMTVATGTYRVSAALSRRAGFPLDDGASIPVRVAYVQTGGTQFPAGTPSSAAVFARLPLAPVYTFPRLLLDDGTNQEFAGFVQALPSGSYLRVLYPEPPFDALFPPRAEADQPVAESTFFDQFFLVDPSEERAGTNPIDPVELRRVDVERAEGLDGWRVWVTDRASGRRISTAVPLNGTSMTAELWTTGEQRGENGGAGLGSTTDLVLNPPADFLAVPRYVSEITSGALGTIHYPALPPPVRVDGRVAEPTVPSPPPKDAQLLGYAARVRFESTTITVAEVPSANALLHYSAEVSTDERGRFATVLPPGTYDVTVEPAEGTTFAKYRQRGVVVAADPTTPILQPPKRTIVRGRALLTDGRPVAEAEILALPQTPTTNDPKPRPNRTTTGADGRFQINLDQGPYVITVMPKKGSGFPHVLTRPQIPVGEADLPDIAVPAPSPLTFTLRDPTRVQNVVPNALVRIFAVPTVTSRAELEDPADPRAVPPPVEIGSALSDANGLVEILLAPGPR